MNDPRDDIDGKALVAQAITVYWGERCPDFDPSCPCCRAWEAHDSILRDDETHAPRERKFALGDRVTKINGSSWTGHVVGFYCTELTPVGYAVESENEPGSVQIYPEAAIRALIKEGGEDGR